VSDDLDRAKDLEMAQRDIALNNQLTGAVETEIIIAVENQNIAE